MLSFLSIKNIVLIDKVEIDFSNGLCVLTGETGAGKSIILDSLCLVIGYRANYSLRAKNEKVTEIIATFSNLEGLNLSESLTKFGIDDTDEIILKRQLTHDGKSKAFVNDNLVSLATLKIIGSQLIEIESQFSEQGLLDSTTHIDILDEFGEYGSLLKQLKEHWFLFQNSKEIFDKMSLKYNKIKDNKENLEFEIKELEKLNPQIDEFENLINKKKNIINSTKIKDNITKILDNFSSDQDRGIEELMSENISHLEKIENFLEPNLQDILKSLDTILIDVRDYKNRFELYYRENLMNSEDIDEIEERIFNYKKISKKHDCKPDELFNKKNELITNRDSFGMEELDIEKQKQQTFELETKYKDLANQITTKRINFAEKVDAQINKELPELKLENSQFKTFVNKTDSFNSKGNNNVIFKISTNKELEVDEIKKISSGGELCRFALAVKVVTSKKNYSSIVFDEVDSGIGGAVASAVGERLRRLGSNRQVIVVTHSPQVAALGNEHFKVTKTEDNSGNQTKIRKLTTSEKLQEIARMISGKEVTNEALMAAKKLLEVN